MGEDFFAYAPVETSVVSAHVSRWAGEISTIDEAACWGFSRSGVVAVSMLFLAVGDEDVGDAHLGSWKDESFSLVSLMGSWKNQTFEISGLFSGEAGFRKALGYRRASTISFDPGRGALSYQVCAFLSLLYCESFLLILLSCSTLIHINNAFVRSKSLSQLCLNPYTSYSIQNRSYVVTQRLDRATAQTCRLPL